MKWLKRCGITAGVLFLVYVLLGFFGVPLILRHGVLAKVNRQLAGTLEVEAFRCNPFTWELRIEGVTGKTPDGELASSFREFRVNVQPASVFGEAFHVKEILLDEPYLNLVIDENGKINIQSALVKLQEQVDEIQEEQEAQEAETGEPFVIPPIRIDNLRVVDAGLRTQIDSFGEPFAREVKHLSFVMNDVSTSADHDNPYSFGFVTASGEEVTIAGELRLDPLSSDGVVDMDALKIQDFLVFAGDRVAFKIASGELDAGFKYHFVPLGESPELALREGAVALRDFKLVAEGEDDPFQTIGRMELTGLGVDLLGDSVSLESFRMVDGSLRVVRDGEGVLNLLRYISPPEKQAAAAAQAQQEKRAEAAARVIRLGVVVDDQDLGVALQSAWEQIQELVAVKWSLSADEVEIVNQSLTWRDEFLPRPAEIRWTGIGLNARNLSNGTKPFPFELGMVMNESGAIQLDGSFTPTPAASAFSFQVDGLPLAEIGPYLDNVAPLRLHGGLLDASGDSEIAFPDAGLPKLSASVQAKVDDFKLDWAETGAPFLAWEQVSVDGATLGSGPMEMTASAVTVLAPKIWVERNAEGGIVLPLPEAPAKPAAGGAAPAGQTASGGSGPPAISVALEQVKVERGVVRVSDQSVSPKASFALADVAMTAGPLAYPGAQSTALDLTFNLADGPSGGVRVKGSAQPLQPLEATEVSIATEGVTLPAFAAYAVPIIGRPPTNGRVTADLGYSVTGGKLDGQNAIKIKDMTFGPRPENTKAPNLPLELGVAILEDSQGIMNIDIPVSGDVNDPKFSLDRTIQYAISNVLEKLVTAPFNALGSMFAGEAGEPAKFVSFEPGQSTVPAEAQAGLKALATVLQDRPLLRLELTPSVAPGADAEFLRSRELQDRIATQTATGVNEDQAINALYGALPADLQLPAAEGVVVTVEQKRSAVRESIPITPFQLRELAEARAQAVQKAILGDNGLELSRVVITEPKDAGRPYAEDGPKVGFGLGVKD